MEKIETSVEIIPETIWAQKMSDEEYFSDKYKDYISNSKLGLINSAEGGSYQKFEEGFKSDYSDSFELGSVVHAMLLQPDSYIVSDIKKPTGKLGIFAEKVYEFRKQGFNIHDSILKASIAANYYSGKLQGKRLETAIKSSLPFYMERIKQVEDLDKKTLYLSQPISDKFEKCYFSLKNNDKVRLTLFPGHFMQPCEIFNELAIFCDFKVTIGGRTHIIKVKGKIDNFVINHEECYIALNDLKTTGKPINYFMGNRVRTFTEETGEQYVWYDGSFQKYHYYRQMALYMMLLQTYCKTLELPNYTFKSNMVVVETIPEFNSKVYPVKNVYIKHGLEEFKNLILEVAKWIEIKEKM